MAVRLNNSPIRCKTLTALPIGDYWGELVAVKENIPLEMRGFLSIGGEETEWHKAWRNEVERNWLLIVGGLVKLLTEVARVSPVGGKSSRKA